MLQKLHDVIADVKYGLRGLRRSPGFTAVAVITLALGIGANTAIFSVVNTVLLRPLPYRNPDRLVMLWQSYPQAGFDRLGASPPEYLDYRNRNQVFTGVAGYSDLSFNLTGVAQPDRIKAARVTGNLFQVLQVPPLLGRILLPDDDRTGGPRLAVVSHSFWKQQLHSDAGVIGRSVRLDEQPYTIVGVMPASFRFPFDGTPLSDRADIWVPMDFSPAEIQARASGPAGGGGIRPADCLRKCCQPAAGPRQRTKARDCRAQRPGRQRRPLNAPGSGGEHHPGGCRRPDGPAVCLCCRNFDCQIGTGAAHARSRRPR
jgi:putative ABC transport system permease protein